MSILRSAIRDIQRPKALAAAGVAVRYASYVSGETFTIQATMGASTTQAETGDGIVFTDVLKDFIVAARDFVPHGVVPQRRDRITWVDDETGTTRVFEALELGGQKAVEPYGNHGDFLRIHTKEIPV